MAFKIGEPACRCKSRSWGAIPEIPQWHKWPEHHHMCLGCGLWAVDIGDFPSRAFVISDFKVPVERTRETLLCPFYEWVAGVLVPSWRFYDENLRQARDPIAQAWTDRVCAKMGLPPNSTIDTIPPTKRKRWVELHQGLHDSPTFQIPEGSKWRFIPPCVPKGYLVHLQTARPDDHNKSEWWSVKPWITRRFVGHRDPCLVRLSKQMEEAFTKVNGAVNGELRVEEVPADPFSAHRGEFHHHIHFATGMAKVVIHHTYWAIHADSMPDNVVDSVRAEAESRERTFNTTKSKRAGTNIEVHADTTDEIAMYLTLIGTGLKKAGILVAA